MMKKVCYYYRDHSGSAGFTLPDDKTLLQRLFNSPVLPADEQLRGKRCWLYARVDGSQGDESAVHALELQMTACVNSRKDMGCRWLVQRRKSPLAEMRTESGCWN